MNTDKKTLIIGAAGKKSPDNALTLDIDPAHHPDIVHDLNITPYPFSDSQFDLIVCHHVLEHLDNIDPVLGELYRICSADGEIHIEVPHHTSWFANTPHHKLRFNYFALDPYFSGNDTWVTTPRRFTVKERKITFHRAFRRYFLHRIFNRFPRIYERFWTYMVPAEHLIFRLSPDK
ncbi:MAG: methyltransferase domain-containing protein [Candidatus Omnitrophica bacterium]|nr:methyltransferase domain-containing protein [Candidatus Omnitrophota bacterium]